MQYMQLEQLINEVHQMNREKGFWEKERNVGEMIALIHSELSEALEAHRKGLDSEKLGKDFTGLEEEMADTVIRILDMAGGLELQLSAAIQAKLAYNQKRPYKHGKNY